jgi:dolichol-phosphate mannosyltransferase
MEENKYTILLPTFNEVDNLPFMIWLINDAFTQSYDSRLLILVWPNGSRGYNWEVIIIEDASPDNTLEGNLLSSSLAIYSSLSAALRLQKIYGKNRIVIHSRSGKLGLGVVTIESFHR